MRRVKINKKLEDTFGIFYTQTVSVVSGMAGCGKTIVSTILGANACKNGENVLYFSSDVSTKTVLRRFDLCFRNNYIFSRKRGDCIFMDFIASQKDISFCDYIEGFLRKRIDSGFKIPDLIFIDNFDLLSSFYKESIEFSYEKLRGIANKYDVAIIALVQAAKAFLGNSNFENIVSNNIRPQHLHRADKFIFLTKQPYANPGFFQMIKDFLFSKGKMSNFYIFIVKDTHGTRKKSHCFISFSKFKLKKLRSETI